MLHLYLPPEAEKEMVPGPLSRHIFQVTKVSGPQQRGTFLCCAGFFNRMQTLAQQDACKEV